jgi:hypothetical protein
MEFIIGTGLYLAGVLLNKNEDEKNLVEENNPTALVNNKLDKNFVDSFPNNYFDNYKSKIYPDTNEFLYNSISNLYEKSVEPGSKIVNNIWRVLNDPYEKEKKFKINNLLNKDINMIKKTSYNNIETMNNIDENNNYDSDDSQFSDNYSFNYSLPTSGLNKINKSTNKTNKLGHRSNKPKRYNDNYSEMSDNYSDADSNINIKVINQQDKFLSDIITNLSGYDTGSDVEPNNQNQYQNQYQNQIPQSDCQTNSFESQFNELKFDHEGIPGTIQNGKQMLNIFNDKMGWKPQSDFNPKSDGRYGVTGDMTHNNMVPFFSSKTYGYNPMQDKERENYSIRQIELFTGSDQNPQFKHKTEVGNLFSPATNKVDSVTGVPNFNDFFESRYIPSQTRNGERPFEPIRTTPGLNLGYNQIGNTGRQDLYRVLPRTVDQLRTVDNPKVSYTPLLNPAHKGERRGIIGDFIQKGPDRFYYNSPDSMLPQVGDHVAPAIYGKWIVNQTNRSLNPDTPGLNPLGGIEKSTPEYLQGQFKRSFKREDEALNPANVQYDTRGQIINQETWIPNETNRQSTNYGDNYAGNATGNKFQSYLENFDNAVPDVTQREITPELPNANITGNYKSVPLINFINFIPDATKRQILLEDNGRKNITNISNSIKGYLFNSINAIKDPTLRDLISQKIILANQKGPQEQNYLFNMTNAITDPNMRNLSEDNLILTNLSNHEQGYLFNNLNAIPDPTLRDLINTLYGRGGLGMKGPETKSQLFNYSNAIPDTTLRELTENIIQLTNITGPVGSVKQYLFNYIDGIPDTTLRELTEDKIVLTGLKPIQVKEYLYNYINAVPDTTLRELTENNVNLIGQKGSHSQDYMFNYTNGIPDTTMRELIEELRQITNLTGNHKAQYLLNYVNAIPDTTLRELTENKEILTNMKPIQVREYLYNYINSVPDTTLRELTENNVNLVGQKGSHTQDYMFNYVGGIPDTTLRDLTQDQKYIIGQKGSHSQDYMFNYSNGIPDTTLRDLTQDQKHMVGQKGSHSQDYMFNYSNGVPDNTNRNMSENTTNITGQKGNRDAMVAFNYLNGVPDNTNRNMSENTTNITGQKGNREAMVAFNYDDRPDLTMRNLSENTTNITGQGSQYAHKEYMFNYVGGVPDDTNRNQTGGTKNITGQKGDGVQSRSRLDYSNALLNNVKEVIAQGRAPTIVKDNKGPTCAFTEYTFNDDRPLAQTPIYSMTKTIGNIPNPLYTFA